MEPTIQEMNEVIALFEGRKKTQLNSSDLLGKTRFWSDAKGVHPFYTDELDYHSNWNSLMAVVDKIKSISKS